VVVVLILAVAGMTSSDSLMTRGSYLAMELIGWSVLVPLALASLLSGLVQSLGTAWGLFQHYWVLLKLLITVLATAVLLMYMETLGVLADVAARPGDRLGVLRTPSVVLHASAALLLLLLATVFAVYKPRGRTRYGWRKREATPVSHT
jgi:hypothetical protein